MGRMKKGQNKYNVKTFYSVWIVDFFLYYAGNIFTITFQYSFTN